jgi:hypothetical protein
VSESTQAATVSESSVPTEGVTLELSYATVPAFDRAVEVARKHPSFQQFGEGKSLRVRVTYQLTELDALQELKDATWDLHHKRAFLRGVEIPWHQMGQLTYCFRELLRKPRRDHCFFDGNFWSVWGCRYAVANLSDRINNEWLSLGHLQADGTWVFDKARITEQVKRNLSSGFQHCPAFDAEFVELMLEIFPERVNPAEDPRWRHLETRQGETIGVGPADVDKAKKILYELQAKIVERRSAERVQENGKRQLALEQFRQSTTGKPKKKKGLLARLFA